ncbi:MAG: alpha/beta hydrolase [Treponema sp.]|nr:alpha/beta hydrolase [Treponema sp.]
MKVSAVPYDGDSPMKPWPALAARAFLLRDSSPGGDTIFFFDSPPEGSSAPSLQQPVLVLIHGLGDEADSWRHLIPQLNIRGYRVLALDLPGFGRSAARKKISLGKHADAVVKLIEAVCPDAPVFLVGNSMGADIAEIAALRRPAQVRGFVLIDGSIPGGPESPGFFVLARILFSHKWYRAYRGNPEKAWVSLYPYYANLDLMPRDDRDFMRQRVMARVESATQERAYFATQRSLVWAHITASSRLARKIKSYPGKILLLWGEKDRIIPLASAKNFQALRQDIGLEIIPGAGHLPQQENPTETARRIVEFVEGL